MTDLSGATLGGRYQVLELIGEGGMAEVYKARHLQLDRLVAIKVLHRFLAKDKGFKVRFEREAQLGARLRHPNIVEVFDYEAREADKLYYIVVEYIDGPSLSDHLGNLEAENRRISLAELLRISRDVASALSYAHAHGMLHRDVKPSNVLLEYGQRVVLTDFGIAKMIAATPSNGQLTASDTMLGTPAYMSPEQALGESGDARADIYSFGIMLYQMATGHLPFHADSPVGLALKHVNDLPTAPSEIDPEIPLELNNIIMRCLMKEPSQRYQRADEIWDDLNVVAIPNRHDNNAITQSYRRGIKRTATVNLSSHSLQHQKTTPTYIQTGSRRKGVLLGFSVLVPLIALGAFLTTGNGFLPSFFNNSGSSQNATQIALNTTRSAENSTQIALQATQFAATSAGIGTPAACVASASTNRGANVRTNAGIQFFILGKLGINSIVPVLGYTEQTYPKLRWWSIDFKGKVGWVLDSEVLLNGDCRLLSTMVPPPTQMPGKPTYTLVPAHTPTPVPYHPGNPDRGNPQPTRVPPSPTPTPRQATSVPPTDVPTSVPPTNPPPTDPPPTDVPPTDPPPTDPPPTDAPPDGPLGE